MKRTAKNDHSQTTDRSGHVPPTLTGNIENTIKPNGLRVFLCHASSDKKLVRALYQRLKADGYNPWLDEENILPGQDWRYEITKAVRLSHAVLVCLSKGSVTKRGFVQREIRLALDVAYNQPEEAIYIIPLRLEDCDVPERLSEWQWVNLFEETGYEKLKRALRQCADTLSSS